MQHLDTGLQRALSAVARADWAVVEHTAHEIRGSFILEQKLSAEQLAELRRVLPDAFLALDREFHGHAERLALAAKRADAELAAFYTYQLIDGCVTCHRQYARIDSRAMLALRKRSTPEDPRPGRAFRRAFPATGRANKGGGHER